MGSSSVMLCLVRKEGEKVSILLGVVSSWCVSWFGVDSRGEISVAPSRWSRTVMGVSTREGREDDDDR